VKSVDIGDYDKTLCCLERYLERYFKVEYPAPIIGLNGNVFVPNTIASPSKFYCQP